MSENSLVRIMAAQHVPCRNVASWEKGTHNMYCMYIYIEINYMLANYMEMSKCT